MAIFFCLKAFPFFIDAYSCLKMPKFGQKLSQNWKRISCEFLYVFVFPVFSQSADQAEAALERCRGDSAENRQDLSNEGAFRNSKSRHIYKDSQIALTPSSYHNP